MNADMHMMTSRGPLLVCSSRYTTELGYGFLESVYREAMSIALHTVGLQVYKEFRVRARFRGQVVGISKPT
jgi:GxxExxY protein